ncbi:efflux RND transporter periplasmic adaptor subunit [Phaeovulum sp. W22_SRMD_FR3]|uniref:efflux RND transporter periplasmic adaptor subunit n=1 Tax=Phaeovulum sp. W22_SRMD_FR3 TaxID=3240274 RepID=UPI003F9DC67D
MLAVAGLACAAMGAYVAIGQFAAPPRAPEAMTAAAVPASMPPAATSAVPHLAASREITGSGYVIAPQQTAVFARGEGRVTALLVQAGDVVAAGQPLIVLSDSATDFALEQAQLARRAAELALAARRIERTQAETSLARITALAAGQVASRQQLEEAQTARDLAANAQLQAQQGQQEADLAVRIAEEQQADLTIRAPIAGTVTRLDTRLGDSVLARADSLREGQSLATITDTAHLVIEADVAETSIALLQAGLPGEAILDAFPAIPFPIEIQRIAPVIAPEKGTVTLRLTLTDPPPGIRPAMAARIRITTRHNTKEGGFDQ